MPDDPAILLVGASVRAAAFSVRRAGFVPHGYDLFADRDLQRCCPVTPIPRTDYPHSLVTLFKNAPDVPWMYTGGLENHPQIIRELAARRPLWGCSARSLRRVRSPEWLAENLRRRGLNYPEVRFAPPPPDDPGRWLVKPRCGAGGTGIMAWPSSCRPKQNTGYFQAFIAGQSYAAIFIGQGASARLIGVTEQLVGQSWLRAKPFAYCGSIGPIELTIEQRVDIERMGQALVEAAGLRGIFGVDLIDHDGRHFLIEVNPRYTASVEVLEYSMGTSVFRHHAAAFDSRLMPGAGEAKPRTWAGKAILFASEPIIFPQEGPWEEDLGVGIKTMPRFADVPVANSLIERGAPILTVFGEGPNRDAVLRRLEELADECYRYLGRA